METKKKAKFKFRLTVEKSRRDKRWRPQIVMTTSSPGRMPESISSTCQGEDIVIMSNRCTEYIENGLVWINARQQGTRIIRPQHHRGHRSAQVAMEEAQNMKRGVMRTLRKAKQQYDAT